MIMGPLVNAVSKRMLVIASILWSMFAVGNNDQQVVNGEPLRCP